MALKNKKGGNVKSTPLEHVFIFWGFFFGGKFSLFCDLLPKKKTSEKSNFVIVKCGFSAHKNSPLLQD
jgi:hypothetical protein